MKKGQFGEPWYEERNDETFSQVFDQSDICVAQTIQPNRIVSCVNALDGLNPEKLQALIEAVEQMAACERITCDNDCDNYVCCETRNLKRALDALKQEETNA